MPPLRFPDRLRAIDGEPVPRRDALRPAAPARSPRGRRRCARGGHAPGPPHLRRRTGPDDDHAPAAHAAAPTRRCSSSGSTRWSALFVLWSGLAVLVLARRRAGAVAYAAWSVGTFVFMVTFYDYHSTAWLAPLFSLSTVWVQICVVWLAYSFPEPPAPPPARAARRRAIAFTAAGAAAAGVLALGPYLRRRRSICAAARGRRTAAFVSLLVAGGQHPVRLRVERGRAPPGAACRRPGAGGGSGAAGDRLS